MRSTSSNRPPTPTEFETVLGVLEDSERPLYKYEILQRADVSWKATTKCLNILRVENATIRVDDGFERTAKDWSYDYERIESITEQRYRELEQIQEFVETDACLTKFIDDVLDGSLQSPCGRCANCTDGFFPTAAREGELVQAAVEHYRRESWEEFSPRYFKPQRNGGKTKIDESRKPEDGRYICQYGDPGLGKLVSDQAETGDRYSDELVTAAVEHIETVWNPKPSPAWVTAVPPESGSDEVTDIAQRIATKLELPYESALEKVDSTAPQHEFANSYQKRWNVEDVFEATESLHDGPVLLVDDTVNSRWTLTEAGMTLRDAGSDIVYPFALAKRTNR